MSKMFFSLDTCTGFTFGPGSSEKPWLRSLDSCVALDSSWRLQLLHLLGEIAMFDFRLGLTTLPTMEVPSLPSVIPVVVIFPEL